MRRTTVIGMAVVSALFILSWVFKSISYSSTDDHYIFRGFLVTFSAFLTLAILSFLYKDNPFYKFAEHLFVGVSAAFWMVMGFWTTIVVNLIPRLSRSLSEFFEVPYQGSSYNLAYFIPVILGILLLMRLSRQHGWLARWPLAFIVGTTAGLNFVRYLRSDFIEQVSATSVPLLVGWQGGGQIRIGFGRSGSGRSNSSGIKGADSSG